MWKLIQLLILIIAVSSIVQMSFQRHSADKKISLKNSKLEEILERGTLRCGYALYPPYLDREPNTGKLTGLSVPMMEEIGRKMGVKIEWTEEVGWDGLAEGLKTGRYDAICGPVWQNTPRALRAGFSIPYAYSILQAWKKSGNAKITGLDSLNHPSIRLAGVDGDGRTLLYANKFPLAQKISLPGSASEANIILDVVTGKTDATVLEPASARLFLKSNPGALERIGNEEDFVSANPLALMLPQDEAAFKNVIDTALVEMLSSGQIEAFAREQHIPAGDIHFANPVH